MKKFLILVLCLVFALTLVACDEKNKDRDKDDEDDDLGGGSTLSTGTSDSSGVTDSSTGTTESSGVTDSSTGTTDSSGVTDSSTGSTESGADTSGSSGNTDESNQLPDDEEMLTIEFKLWAGEVISGETVITVKLGQSISLAELPVVEREGYVLAGWAVDTFGEELWTEDYVFTKSMTLVAIWELDNGNTTESSTGGEQLPPDEKDPYEELKSLLSSLVNYETNTAYVYKTGNDTVSYTVKTRIDSENEYMQIVLNDSSEEIWYFNGVYYFYSDQTSFKATIPYEKYEEYKTDGLSAVTFISAIRESWIKSITVNGDGSVIRYNVTVDGEQYTEYLEAQGALSDIAYSDLVYTLSFDNEGTLKEISLESDYVQGGVSVGILAVSEVSNVGAVLVEGPANGDEFIDVTEALNPTEYNN